MQPQTSTTTTNNGLKGKTHVQTGGWSNHTQTLARPAGLRVKTHVKAGGIIDNHSQTLVRHSSIGGAVWLCSHC